MSEAIDPYTLIPGYVYTLSRDTPLMPEPNPRDPIGATIGAIKLAKKVGAGGAVKVVGVFSLAGVVWYEVYIEDAATGVTHMGWISSRALIGQDLQEKRIDD